MTHLPDWLPAEAVEDLVRTVRERQAETRRAKNRSLAGLDAGESEEGTDAARNYEQALRKQRHAEGELLWGALGYAITDIAETADADGPLTMKRGEAFLTWAIDADILETVTGRDRINVEVARRYPTLPPSHVPYVESMLELTRDDITRVRERDQERLSRER